MSVTAEPPSAPTTSSGTAHPLGPSFHFDPSDAPLVSINFAVHTPQPSLHLVLFPPLPSDSTQTPVTRNPYAILPFSARTGQIVHILVHGLHPDATYCLHLPSSPTFLLSDPFAKWLESPSNHMWMRVEGENFSSPSLPASISTVDRVLAFLHSFPALKRLGVAVPFRPCRVMAPVSARMFDWQGSRPPRLSVEDVVIYEAHVRALTARGTFAAAVERVPYWKWLGVTAVQLMPVFEFAELEIDAYNGECKLLEERVRKRKGNMWGYSPMSWFSVMNRYAEDVGEGGTELKRLVRALHMEGMECYLDVVYNHSANSACPLHFLGVQKEYYMGEGGEGGKWKHCNVSGCGNTLSPNSPAMLELVKESLRWFVSEFQIDGFRIDAAGVLCRGPDGKTLTDPEVIRLICADPLLEGVKFIVEGWDAGDQVGSPNMLLGSARGFPRGERFCEWNVEWRDAVRRFEKGEPASARSFCKALRGSAHLFGDGHGQRKGRPLGAGHGVNFVSCHDGFCMRDVVSYRKRVNTDGYDEISFNCGAEGETKDGVINARRAQHLRNLMFYLAISRGIPMILQGDEVGFTKRGNSNPYNDPELYAAKMPGVPQECTDMENIVHFTKKMLNLRRSFTQLRGSDFLAKLKWLDEFGKERKRGSTALATSRSKEKAGPGKEQSRRGSRNSATRNTEDEISQKRKRTSSGLRSSGASSLVAFEVQSDDGSELLYVCINNSKMEAYPILPIGNNRTVWTKLVDTSSTHWNRQQKAAAHTEEGVAGGCEITIERQSSVLYQGRYFQTKM